MVNITIGIEDEDYDVLIVLAEQKEVTVDELLQSMTVEDLARIRSRLTHPILGAFASGRSDVSERDEEIMYGRKDE